MARFENECMKTSWKVQHMFCVILGKEESLTTTNSWIGEMVMATPQVEHSNDEANLQIRLQTQLRKPLVCPTE